MQPTFVGSLSARFLCSSLEKSMFWNPIMFVRLPLKQERLLFFFLLKAAKGLSGRLESTDAQSEKHQASEAISRDIM